MDYNYNPNGQYGYTPQGYYMPQYNQMPQFVPDPVEEEKRKNKKILKKMGSSFGLAIISYVVLSTAVVFVLWAIADFVPSLSDFMNDGIGIYGLNGILSVLFIGGPFLVAYLYLKSKKYIGILPFGTTYNKKAAICLVMIFAPIMLISTIAINFVSLIIQELLGASFESGLEDMSASGVLGAIILTISLAIIPAIIEEFCVRGVILQSLRRYGDKFAILMSALIFSILHGNMVQIPYTFVAGLYFGYVCVATGSIWPSIVLHFINNFYSAIIEIADSNWGENAAEIASLAILGLLVVSGIVGAVIFVKMNYKTKLKSGVTSLKATEKCTALFKNVPMVIAIIILLISTATSINLNS